MRDFWKSATGVERLIVSLSICGIIGFPLLWGSIILFFAFSGVF